MAWLWMPVLDGLHATQQLKADPATAHVPILALSAQVFRPGADDVIAAGCDRLITKPVDPDALADHIRSAFVVYLGRKFLRSFEGLTNGRFATLIAGEREISAGTC